MGAAGTQNNPTPEPGSEQRPAMRSRMARELPWLIVLGIVVFALIGYLLTMGTPGGNIANVLNLLPRRHRRSGHSCSHLPAGTRGGDVK
jgi:hypothetical protein